MPLPKISVVTPSLDQARWLEQALVSVQQQPGVAIEHIVIDGGSRDGSLAIIERHRARLAHAVSEPDAGQFDAVNKGFARATGEIMGWLNADDVYLPGALTTVAEIFAAFPQIDWLTTRCPIGMTEQGALIPGYRVRGYDGAGFYRGDFLPGAGWPAIGCIQQESTFWRRRLWERAGGGLDASLRNAGDFELWARFFAHAPLCSVAVPIACFRNNPNQKTVTIAGNYVREAAAVLARHGRTRPAAWRHRLALTLRHQLPRPLHHAAARLGLIRTAPAAHYDWEHRAWRLAQL